MISYKLGFIFFNSLYHKLTGFPYSFGGGIKLTNEKPSISEGNWRKWLGTLKWEEVETSNVIIENRIETEKPEILNEENDMLKRQCGRLWAALMLTDSYFVENAYFLTGSEINNNFNLRDFLPYEKWFNPGHNYTKVIKDNDVNTWKLMFNKLQDIFQREECFIRLRTGIRCFVKGCSEIEVFFRLPYFVRSLEALLLPDKGNTKKQFSKRTAKWWKESGANETLREIYDIRCVFEHMHELNIQSREKELLRSYQCEELTRNAYQKILLSDSELEHFLTDESIKKYWNKNKL